MISSGGYREKLTEERHAISVGLFMYNIPKSNDKYDNLIYQYNFFSIAEYYIDMGDENTLLRKKSV